MKAIPIMEIKNISKKFKKNLVIKNLSFNVYENQILVIIGKSGCGKSTLYKILIGIYEIDKGVISYHGSLINNFNIKKTLKHIIGFVSQENSFYESLTSYENLYFFGNVYGIKKKENKYRVEYLSKLVNLYGFKDILVENLSGGMKRRLEFAISLIHDPKILILDEPFTGLDLFLIEEIWEIIYEIKKQVLQLFSQPMI